MTGREQATMPKEVRCTKPDPTNGYTVVDESEFGFCIRHNVTGETFRCYVGWNGQSNWFKEVA